MVLTAFTEPTSQSPILETTARLPSRPADDTAPSTRALRCQHIAGARAIPLSRTERGADRPWWHKEYGVGDRLISTFGFVVMGRVPPATARPVPLRVQRHNGTAQLLAKG